MRVRSIEVEVSGDGKGDEAFKKYLVVLPIKSGQQLNQPAYEQLKQRLQEIAARRGYIDAKFLQSMLRVDPQQYWADIILHFETGPRYYFGRITFVQNFMDTSFLNRYITFKQGDPYDAGKLLNLEYALNDSGYFASVNVEVLRKQATSDRHIPIRIVLTPGKRNKYILGIGYGTDTGPRTTLGWENRRLNDYGHSLSTYAQYSHILETAQVNYSVPLSNPASERLVYGLGYYRQILGDTVAYTSILGMNHYTSLGPWSETQYLQLEHDRSDFATGPLNSTLVLPGTTFSRTYSDDPVLPTRGYRAMLDIRGTDTALGSDTSFLQMHFLGKVILPFNDTTRLLLRGEVGATAVSNFAELPLSQRFFAGGDQSVRGFAYNSLSPTDQNGNLIGGQYLLVGSVEIDHFFGRIFGMDAFVDAGNASNSFTASLEKGVGAGLRWRTPVGMVRFDVAHPIRRPDLDRVRIHISIGPDL